MTFALLPSARAIDFNQFMEQYQAGSQTQLNAHRQWLDAKNLKEQRSDLWKSRLEATPEMNFLERKFDSGAQPDVSNRSQNINASLRQDLPTGTSLLFSGQKFLEIQNPLFSSLDRSYSAKLTQDLVRNSFGLRQRAELDRAETALELAELQYRQALLSSCEEGFKLYTETFSQQENVQLLREQLREAEKAQKISQQLYRDRLIQKMDQLSSQSDFINTQIQTDSAEQKLFNDKQVMLSYLIQKQDGQDTLISPEKQLPPLLQNTNTPTLYEQILRLQTLSQEKAVDIARTDRWTDLKLGVEAGERFGRFGFSGPLLNYNENYLQATLTVGFDLINRTEDSALRTAIEQHNSLQKQQQFAEPNQRSKVKALLANDHLMKTQIELSEQQVRLLKDKMDLASDRMKRARLDFENYLLHRNSYLNQKMNLITLRKNFWLNRFALIKEWGDPVPVFCKGSL